MNNVLSRVTRRITSEIPVSAWFLLGLMILHSALLAFIPTVLLDYGIDHRRAEFFYSSIVLGIAFLRLQQTSSLQTRFFWLSLLLAVIFWWIAKLLIVMAPIFNIQDVTLRLNNFAYFAFYFIFIFAISLSPFKAQINSKISLNQVAALLFTVACFSYLVLVPTEVDIQVNEHNSSFIFYMVMDLYLCAILLSEALRIPDYTWRTRYILFAVTFAYFFFVDLAEVLMRAADATFSFAGLLQMPWLVPYFLLAFAFTFSGKQQNKVRTIKPQLPNHLIMLTFALPLVHVTGYGFGFFSEQSHTFREVVLAVWLIVFAILLVYRDRHRTSTSTSVSVQASPNIINIDDLSFGCIKLSPAGRITEINTAITNLLGYRADELNGQLFNTLLSKDEPLAQVMRFSESHLNTTSEGYTKNIDICLRDKSAQTIPCYIGIQKRADDSIVINVTDIRGLKTAEEQALSIKDRFIANITHEFRTPLTIINGALDEAIEQIKHDKLLPRMHAAKSNTIRVLKMVEQLLNLSKLTSAPKIKPTKQPLSEIVRLAALQFRPLAVQRNINYECDVEQGLWADVAEDAIQQIISNLLGNAFKYTPEGGKIQFTLTNQDNTAIIEVEDTGPGISESQQKQIFQRFQRATENHDEATFGVGIGLALVNELVAVHHWTLTLTSDGKQGALFRLSLPITQASVSNDKVDVDYPLELEEISAYTGSTNDTTIVSDKDIKLLIIEDNPDMQEYLTHLMSEHYSVKVTTLGQDGIDYAIQQVPDIIICDLMLPDISGFEVIEQLKQNIVTAHIPILMLTARSDMNSKLEGLAKKADDYLTKPFHHQELHLRLRNLFLIRQNIQAHLQATLYQNTHQSVPAIDPTQPSGNQETMSAESEILQIQSRKFIENLQNITEKNYTNETFSLPELASDMALSERQLQRKMKALTNLSPGEYLKQFRLEKAKQLMLEGKPIGVVASDVGFTSQAYFTKCFKEAYQLTPTAFLKQTTPK